MNYLNFKIEKLSYPYRGKKWRFAADTYIDGTSLDDLLKTFELPYRLKRGTKRENIKMEEKSYYGVDADDLYHDLTCWTRGNIREEVELCCCPFCLSDLCVSVYVTVEEKDDVVIWRDFENPAQLCEYPDVYKKFGPFEFEKEQYREAVSNLGMGRYRW